ncbi:unnamed protein product [Plutella xylostella]|uniref:(diamondback moth) hypothetical protein n=1 Tax=Plutella xylostella TaxID=51655 RepID=A0A8S4FY22_PLUXY|nr:unnamed protein product [Plutella xylostella]
MNSKKLEYLENEDVDEKLSLSFLDKIQPSKFKPYHLSAPRISGNVQSWSKRNSFSTLGREPSTAIYK